LFVLPAGCRYCCLPASSLLLLPPQVLYLSGANRPGLLTALSAALRDLGLEVSKAIVETDSQNNKIADKFFVTRREGGKVLQVRAAGEGT
jgi:UTP:GlnB (protein PII) uridylyltransferase